jgi:hypothetical protein
MIDAGFTDGNTLCFQLIGYSSESMGRVICCVIVNDCLRFQFDLIGHVGPRLLSIEQTLIIEFVESFLATSNRPFWIR